MTVNTKSDKHPRTREQGREIAGRAGRAIAGAEEMRLMTINSSRTPAVLRALGVALLASVAALLLAAPASALQLEGFDVTFEGPQGEAAMAAGGHPFALTTTFRIPPMQEGGLIYPAEALKDIRIDQVEGLAGIPTAVPRCSSADFLEEPTKESAGTGCSNASVLGTVQAEVGEEGKVNSFVGAVYDLVPVPGFAARLGFRLPAVRIVVDLGLSESAPYRVFASIRDVSQGLELFGSKFVIWGNPHDPAHDPYRGECLKRTTDAEGNLQSQGECHVEGAETPFLISPRACTGPLSTAWLTTSWQYPAAPPATGSALTHGGFDGCGGLGFSPSITAQPTSKAATSPTGLDFGLDVSDPGLTDPKGLAGADIEKAEVTLPEGMSVNPSQAEGLAVCTEADLARESSQSEFGAGCPAASKIGSVEIETPLLPEDIFKGSLFVATPYENPFGSLIAFYIVIKDPELGIDIVQPAKVTPNPVTGQLVTTTEQMPQLPFSHFRLHFKEGTRSPLVTPPACGSYDLAATLSPYSGGAPVTSNSIFQVISGPDSGPCPSGGTPPFHPGLTAGTINNAAGRYSPFNVRLFRSDSEQEITHFSIKLPPGVTGKLAGIPFCSDLQIVAAKARERQPHGGQEELDDPSCPAASEIGHTLAGAGVGPSLTYVPGKVYLAGPYHGSNLSIVAITAAKAGPFDLGTVVVREAIKVDPETAEVSVDAAGSDPLPHIIDGIPVHLRDVRVYVDRPEFVLNPTSCTPTSTASTVLGSGTNFATEADDRPVTVTTRFQAADCASLGFKPKLKLMLKGPTRRAGLPKLKAVVTARPGDANIGRAVVTLPKSEFLEQGHIGTVCTRVQFNAGPGNGAECPARAVYGHAVAITPLLSEPLTGPVFLRSNGGERRLPDLVAAMHSKDIDIDLLGFIKSLHPKGSDISRIRTVFASVPDAPVRKFTLEMFGGKKGLLINSTNLCKGKHRAISTFVGQNGRRSQTRSAVKAQCPQKVKVTEVGWHGKKGRARIARALGRRVSW